MKVLKGSEEAKKKLKKSVVTMGVFDGVHLGHQALLKQCRQRAQRLKATSVVYTFDPHPVKILFPEACPALLNTTAQKIALFEQFKIDACVIETFTKRFSQLKPETFFKRIIVDRLRTQELIVGYDFTFGTQRRGTTATLHELGAKLGVAVSIVDAFLKDGHLVSSTVTRQQVHEGQVDVVEILLGRPYFIDGTVVTGHGLGRQLGFPTANIATSNELLPASGVYATRIRVNKRKHNSLTNIGMSPTFRGKTLRIETHILNFRRKITGQNVRLEFLKRLRAEKQFSGPEELIAQINKDISWAHQFFKERRK